MIAATSQARFDDLYRRLLIAGVQRDLPSFFKGVEAFSDNELSYLMGAASQLALGSEAQHQRQAYNVATLVPSFADAAALPWAESSEHLLARLGNFPGRTLMRRRFVRDAGEVQVKVPTLVALESLVREQENRIQLSDGPVLLTDFQFRLLSALRHSHTVSVSAPTSAGKSFVLSLYVLERLERREPLSLVYIVPTIALIRQVMADINRWLKRAGLTRVSVVQVPQPPAPEQIENGIIYVLTQERLTALLNSEEGKPFVSTLIVDEAHEIQSDRGVILQSAIEEVLRQFPSATLFFSAPLSANPEYFLQLFNRVDGGEQFVEAVSPVSQNLLLVSGVKGKPKQAKIELMAEDDTVNVGTVSLGFSLRDTAGRAARVAHAFTRDEDTSIVFANTPGKAEETAAEIAEHLPDAKPLDGDIADLIDFLETHIHRKYLLIEYLRRGVAFHYGKMPIVVRTRIEDLLRLRKVRFVACTTTLLQGVNLPAKNIFIDRPRKGKDTPMGRADFWNLAGRAGRMSEEFHGNVWCICRDDWQEDPLSGERLQRLGASLVAILSERTDELIAVIRDRDLKQEHDRRVEEAFGNIFANYTLRGRHLVDSPLASPDNRVQLARVDHECDLAKPFVRLPPEVFQRNTSISPWRLEALRTYFARQLQPAQLLILPIYQPGFYDRIQQVYQVLDQFFFLRTNNSYKYFAFLTHQWVTGNSLHDIIVGRLQFYNKAAADAATVTKEIRDLLEDLEKDLHFEYVKYLRAYNDVLRAFLLGQSRTDLAKRLVPLHQFIEYGASSHSLINLMGLGISRITALLLDRIWRLPQETTREQWLARLQSADLGRLDIPRICKQEIENVRRR